MATDLKRAIEHFFIVIMENRSFDHMLGYLNLPPWNHDRKKVEGVQLDPGWLARYTNFWHGQPYPPHQFTARAIDDPPHTRDTIWIQLGPSAGAGGSMTGFVQSYALRDPAPRDPSDAMGYYTAPDVPMFDFFARYFAVCDHWFAPIPTGTQPNRFMAMSGSSPIDDNAALYLPDQDLVYDWLTARQVTWRVYHDGVVPFFGMMRKWMETIDQDDHTENVAEQPHFRWFDHFAADIKNMAVALPQVIFIEPDYTDIPFGHSAPPNDDHPASSIDEGQKFLRRIYQAITSRPDIWSRSALIVTYDEHGGFFDHVDPLAIRTDSPAGYRPFATTGPRVPAFIISPFVQPGDVVSANFDHTSILKLLAERFEPTSVYSDAVERRLQGNPALGRLSQMLTLAAARPEILQAPDIHTTTSMTENARAFHQAVTAITRRSPDHLGKYFTTPGSPESP